MKDVIIIGAVGTAVNIIEQIQDSKSYAEINIKGIIIDSLNIGTYVAGVKVIGGLKKVNELVKNTNYSFIFALYKPDCMEARAELNFKLGIPYERYCNFIHPSSYVAKSVVLLLNEPFFNGDF